MPQVNLNREQYEVNDGLDSIVVVNCLGDIPGGRTLDVSGLGSDVKVVKAGHILIEDAKGKVLPLGVNTAGNAYVTLPANHNYLGVLKASVSVKDARAAILTMGQVNAAASPYPVTDAIIKGLPQIQFLYRK